MPLNLLGDFAGGGMLLTLGVASAAYERSRSGEGQVIDAAMVDGAAMILGPMFVAAANGSWGERGTNFLDGGSHFYNVYETADGKWMAVGAIEPQFYRELLRVLGLEDDGRQWDKDGWPAAKIRFAARFADRSRAEWEAAFTGTDACVAPVIAPDEVETHPHTAAREVVIRRQGVAQPNVAPRFSRTPGVVGDPVHPGSSSLREIVSSWS
jgi:alpha-methylacyl-CoA racemase